MADKDFMKDLSIDEILDEVKIMNGESTGGQKMWSLDEIDALLSDVENSGSDAEKTEDYSDLYSDSVPEEIKTDDDSDDVSAEALLNDEAEKTENGYKEDEKIQSAEDSEEDFEEEIKSLIDEYRPHTAETVNISDKREASGGLGLIEFARTKGVIEENEAEISKEISGISDEETEYPEEKPQEIEPLIDSAEVDTEPESDEAEDAVEQEKEELPGQISIEKTRVFNEVEARAVRDESISHNIGAKKVIKTGEVPKQRGMETDPYRERFLNRPQLNIEKTQEHRELLSKRPPKTVERHGVVVKRPVDDKTGEDGLSPVPHLIDAADEYDAQQRLEMETQNGALKSNAVLGAEEQLDNQIVLDGFSDDDEVEIVNEYEEEEKLLKARRDKASKFRLFPNLENVFEEDEKESETDSEQTDYEDYGEDEAYDSEADEDIDGADGSEKKRKPEKREAIRVEREFFGPKDSKAVYEIYVDALKKCRMKIIVSAVILGILLVSSVITSDFGSFALFADSPAVYSAVNILLLFVCAGINFSAVRESFGRIKKKKADYTVAVTAALAVGLLQSIVSLGYGDLVLSGTHIYAAVAVFAVLLINFAELIKTKNDIHNFILLNKEHGKFYAVKAVEDEEKAFEIGRGLMIKDPDIRYGAKAPFPYKFVEMSRTADPTADMFRLVMPVAAAAAVFVGIVSGIVNKNLFTAVSSLAGVFLMAMPSAYVVSVYAQLSKANKILNSEGGMVSGYEAVDNALAANAVVLDSSDLFRSGGADFYGIKLFNSMRIDEAILYTAAVVIESNGALSDVFDGIIMSKREILPAVESLAYEERLGCSGWIYNYRVLVGNRDLLIKHNVEVQSKEDESIFTRDGRRVVYLAVEGKVAAMFVVGYKADETTAEYLQKLERAGVSILVRTTDANVSEEMVEQYFDLPHNFIKVMSPVAGVMLKELREEEAENEPCRLLYNGKVNAFLRSFTAAFILNDRRRLGLILQYIGIGIGILVMALLSFLSGLTQAGVLRVLLFQTLWSLFVIFIPRIKKI